MPPLLPLTPPVALDIAQHALNFELEGTFKGFVMTP